MNGHPDTARPLYLELRALGLKLRVEDDPDGVALDYRIAVEGLRSLPNSSVRRLRRRIRGNEEELVRVLLLRDPDLEAVRREGHCG